VSYNITVLPAALRQLRKLPPEGRRRAQAAIELLAETPRARPAPRSWQGGSSGASEREVIGCSTGSTTADSSSSSRVL